MLPKWFWGYVIFVCLLECVSVYQNNIRSVTTFFDLCEELVQLFTVKWRCEMYYIRWCAKVSIRCRNVRNFVLYCTCLRSVPSTRILVKHTIYVNHHKPICQETRTILQCRGEVHTPKSKNIIALCNMRTLKSKTSLHCFDMSYLSSIFFKFGI